MQFQVTEHKETPDGKLLYVEAWPAEMGRDEALERDLIRNVSWLKSEDSASLRKSAYISLNHALDQLKV